MYGSNQIYMDIHTITHGKECQDCLRWFVPVFTDKDPCPHCERIGKPPYPNRVRFLAIQEGISLKELSRITGIAWTTVLLVSQGKRSPLLSTKRKISKALGMSIKKTDISYIFPNERKKK